ncbi:endonuclease subunit 2 [Ochrobactrum phage vB_OspM_OC]|nr:endonuclease subunit 2 [Ochrobactrum phage vB_OspM_OC]
MIKFKWIEYKNILATGNHPIKIDFEKSKTTLIFGKNGRGKSTIISAFSYAIFGKDFRGITKDKLINSINKKGAEIKICFEKNHSEYIVHRGIKPDIFEITKDGEPIDADAGSKRELQDYLESHILGFGYETFKQIVVIASGKYQPFMLLKTAERRRVTETILGLDVFSVMSDVMKEFNDKLNTEINSYDNDIKSLVNEIQTNKSVIERLEKANKEGISSKREKIKSIQSEIDQLTIDQDKVAQAIEKLSGEIQDVTKYEEAETKLKLKVNTLQTEYGLKNKEVTFLKGNESCPTCKNPFDPENRKNRIHVLCQEIDENQKASKEYNDKSIKIRDVITTARQKANDLQKLTQRSSSIAQSISDKRSMIDYIEREIEKEESTGQADTSEYKNKLDLAEKDLEEKRITKDSLYREREVMNISKLMMKDTAIKAEVIEQYIPLFNELMNMYLEHMNFYVEFTLDSSFNETIKSRYRDNFTYENFSEGEKQRIDLAILFAWREIARRRNNINTNILFLDEVGDSSMDSEGVHAMLSIFDTLQANIFIISHSEAMKEHITDTIEFVKENNFSVMRENRQ